MRKLVFIYLLLLPFAVAFGQNVESLTEKANHLYREGKFSEAMTYYRSAAEKGYAEAQLNLGVCYYYGRGVERNLPEAKKWFQAAAEQENSQAQYNLGLCYYEDGDYTKAAEWYRKAAEQGHDGAQALLAVCYLNGVGVEKNYAEGDKWLRASAAQGNVEAFYNLGVGCYNNKNYEEAKKWLSKAIMKGHTGAAELLLKIPKE